MAVIFTLGGQLLFERVPPEIKDKPIRRASQILGVAICVLPIASFVYYFTPMVNGAPQIATAMNLSAYCLTSTLVTLAYYTMLDKTKNKAIIKTHIATGILYSLPLWYGIIFCDDTINYHILIAMYTLFVVIVIIHVATCLIYFRQVKRSITPETPEYKRREFKLLNRTKYSSLILITVSVLAPSFYSYPLWLGLIFVCTLVIGFTYTYAMFRKMLNNSIKEYITPKTTPNTEDHIVEVPENIEKNTKKLNDDVKQNIKKYLQNWINKKEFLKPDVSIDNVAKATYSNRTYISRYINSEYNCSFRSWITQLRVEEAKELLKNHRELSVKVIAQKVGFASVESFSHIFARYVKSSPTKWRDDNATH